MISTTAAPVTIKSKYSSGFTLLELLVVIVIVGILISFTALTIRGTDPDELIKVEAQRFNQLMQLALEEAILRGLEYGIAFTPNSYVFLVQQEDKTWLPLDDKLLRKRELEHDIEIELTVDETGVVLSKPAANASGTDADANITDASNEEDKGIEPQVFLLSSNEITPEFSARFIIRGFAQAHQVDAFIDGKHEVKRSE